MLFGKTSSVLALAYLSTLLTALGTARSHHFLPVTRPPATRAYRLEEPPACRQFVTRHRVRIAGKELAYTAIVGDTHLTNLAGDWVGDLFSFTYLLDDSTQRNRPVLFVFNGGPGSSSLWLHLGIMGPRRVVLSATVNPSVVPPFGLEDNPNCPLDVADIVFIDPIGTGYSHLAGKGTAADFFGVEADANVTAQFIERWLTAHGRWNAPKFIMGESYGSVRAAVLPGALMGGPTTAAGVMRGITVNGIILLGTTLTVPGRKTAAEEAREAALRLPSLAATAWYHRPAARRAQPLPALHDEAAQFAQHDYLPGLLRAGRGALAPAERQRLLGRLTQYTGLPATAFDARLRLSTRAFAQQLLAGQQLTVGMYDSRYTLPTPHAGTDPVADDPAMGQYVPGFVAAFHDYLPSLGVRLEQPYGAIVWQGLNSQWNWARPHAAPGQTFAGELATAMRNNSKLRVLVAAGYYDLVTTAAAARADMERAHPPADRITYRTYASGHMLYLGDTAEAFAQDVRALIRQAR